jgi:hypothetical protein
VARRRIGDQAERSPSFQPVKHSAPKEGKKNLRLERTPRLVPFRLSSAIGLNVLDEAATELRLTVLVRPVPDASA